MNIKTMRISALMIALSGLATSASASIDQQNTPGSTSAVRNIGTTSPTVSQSFTAHSNAINFATFFLYATSTLNTALPTDTATYRVDLLKGNGTTGAVIASSASKNLAFQLDQTHLLTEFVMFDFASKIDLAVGSTYTAELVDVTSTAPFKLGVGVTTGDQYAGGTWFNGTDPSKQNSTNGVDLIFSEGFTPLAAAVPEPGSVALLMGGLGVMGLIARRRKTPR